MKRLCNLRSLTALRRRLCYLWSAPKNHATQLSRETFWHGEGWRRRWAPYSNESLAIIWNCTWGSVGDFLNGRLYRVYTVCGVGRINLLAAQKSRDENCEIVYSTPKKCQTWEVHICNCQVKHTGVVGIYTQLLSKLLVDWQYLCLLIHSQQPLICCFRELHCRMYMSTESGPPLLCVLRAIEKLSALPLIQPPAPTDSGAQRAADQVI